MSDYITEQNEREKDCAARSRKTLLTWALGSGAVYGGVTYALHMFYPPVTRINFRFKVIPVCMATLATAYYSSEVVLNDCRREYVTRSYTQEVKERSAAWAARKQAMQHNNTNTNTTSSSHSPSAHHSTTTAASISPKTATQEATLLTMEKH